MNRLDVRDGLRNDVGAVADNQVTIDAGWIYMNIAPLALGAAAGTSLGLLAIKGEHGTIGSGSNPHFDRKKLKANLAFASSALIGAGAAVAARSGVFGAGMHASRAGLAAAVGCATGVAMIEVPSFIFDKPHID